MNLNHPQQNLINNDYENKVNERAHQILALWYQGNTLEEIGHQHNLTRERARQIIENQLRKEIKNKFLDYGISEIELQEIDLASFIRLEKKAVKEMKERKQVVKEIEKVNNSGIDPNKFYSVRRFIETLKVSETIIEKYFPEIAELIKTNEEAKKKRWSRDYLRCRQCGTTSIKHRSLGLCRRCYIKSEHFKEILDRSRIKNEGHWKERQKEYSEKYLKRPEVLERKRQETDLKFFSGNREKAIQKVNSQCSFCHISRQESYNKYGRDLYVSRLGDKHDNSLDNLLVTCMDCFQKKEWKEKGKLPRSIRRISGKRKSMNSIINLVANYYGVKPNDILGKRRKRKFVTARMVTAFLMRSKLGASFPKIGKRLGGKDHTTMIHAYKKISKEYNENTKIKKDIENLVEAFR